MVSLDVIVMTDSIARLFPPGAVIEQEKNVLLVVDGNLGQHYTVTVDSAVVFDRTPMGEQE